MAQAAEVFVSYSREDKERVLSLAKDLRSAGVSLWIDEGNIDGATMWGEEIVNALENAKVLLLMVSEKSVVSHNVVKEVVLASERKEHILPIHLEPTHIPSGLKYPLAGIQHIEYFKGEPIENLKTIIRSLERIGVTIRAPEPSAESSPNLGSHTAQHSIHSSEPEVDLGQAVAVLPFDNLSPDKETDYFSDGLTEELINVLSVINEIELVSRMTSGQYKGSKLDARTIGRDIGARYIVGGSVRKFQDNLRITARLVDAGTNRELWAQTYKGKLEDIFDIQEQVAQQIAEALKVKLSVTEKVGLTKRATLNPEAYDLYLRGKDYLYRFTKRNVEYSIQLFEKAIELDPRYAAAYAGCSSAYGQLYQGFSRDEQYKDKAQELSFKALMYDTNLSEAYAAMGLSYFLWGKFDEATTASRKAIELDPDDYIAFWTLGRIFYSQGMLEQATELFQRVIELKPSFYVAHADLKMVFNGLNKLSDAKRVSDRLLELLPSYLLQNPDDARARMIFAINLAEENHKQEALAEGKKALELNASDPIMLYNAACLYSRMGEIKLAIKTLADAIDAGQHHYQWIKNDTDLDPIRNDPGYIELMKGK